MAKLTLTVEWDVSPEDLERMERVIEDYMTNGLLAEDLETYPHPDNEDLDFGPADYDVRSAQE
jgi:hypothetical protein